ncbi:MAG TPA: HlyD family type I secretion periplasmic adaptor subunit [Caulobacteraceae bacterium]|nr:HlyD family type I secretion periplasmic adaptor subunit [Caulobacteraceae bacterium]
MTLPRHLRALADAWKEESKRRRSAGRSWADTDFLPAALEVTESPSSPVGHAIIWVIIAVALIALIWAFTSRMDTVAVAEGRLVPSGRLRSVEAAEQGVIAAIDVREGQHVSAGDTLIELDPTAANADASSARSDLSTAGLTRARDNALLAFAAGGSPAFAAPQGAEPTAVDAERQLVAARIEEYRDRLDSLRQRRAGAEDTLRATQAEIDKLRLTLPLLKETLDSQQDLDRQGYGAHQRLLQAKQVYLTAQEDLISERAKLDEARAQSASIGADAAQAREEFVGKAAQERAEAEGVVATRGDSVRKADERKTQQRLTAPVSGMVQEVTVTNIGEVPEIGKPLITIVPDGEPLVVEALLLNRDAGFVRQGMRAVVKLDAFPFTRYGTLEGVVAHVSPDATVDQQRGLVFPVRVRLAQRSLRVDGRPAVLTAGMSAQVEVITGSRRVIDYLWSPVARATREAGRER